MVNNLDKDRGRTRETDDVSRATRHTENQSRLESRIEAIRKSRSTAISHDMNYKNPFYIPPNIIPDGFNYRYVVLHIRGQENVEKIAYMRSKDWDFVPPSRHPELCDNFYSKIGKGDTEKPYIYRAGQVLMERPKVFCDEEKVERRAMNMNQMNNPALSHLIKQSNKEISMGQGTFGR